METHVNETTVQVADTLLNLGFKTADCFADITDKPIANLVYLSRQYQDQHQYLALMSGPWENAPFTEATLFVYQKPFHSRAKQKQIPLRVAILRGIPEIVAAVEQTY